MWLPIQDEDDDERRRLLLYAMLGGVVAQEQEPIVGLGDYFETAMTSAAAAYYVTTIETLGA